MKPYADSSALSSLARVERQTGESDDFAHRPPVAADTLAPENGFF